MKALVTGGGGFLGLYIVEQLLARGATVRTFSRKRYAALEHLDVETFQGDIRDESSVVAACKEIDTVFHTAAIAGIWGRWKDFYDINTKGTQNVVSGCLKHNVAKLVYTSSPSVTFDGSDQIDIDETAPYPGQWLCHYPHTKALAEQHVLECNGKNGLTTCALRPHLIWGPRDQHLIPRLLQRARSGKLRRIGDSTNVIDMVYVENAAQAHLDAAERMGPGSPIGGESYFISQGTPINCWDWIDDILVLAGLERIKKSISFEAAWKIGHAMEIVYRTLSINREPRMTRFLAAQLAKSHYFSIQKAIDHFGYQPAVSTEEGMRRLKEELNHLK